MDGRDKWLNKKDERMVDWRKNARDKWINKKDKRMVDWKMNVRNKLKIKRMKGWLIEGLMLGMDK